MDSSQEDWSSPQPTSPSANGESNSSVASASMLPSLQCGLAQAKEDTDTYAVTFEFLNDGAANAVFRILPCPPQDTPGFVFKRMGDPVPRSEMLGKVLRISKGKPKTLSSDHVVEAFEDQIRPLFRPRLPDPKPVKPIQLPGGRLHDPLAILPSTSYEHFLLEHELVDLSKDVTMILLLPQFGASGLRVGQQHGQRGIILPDMSAVPGVSLTVEIKPKWLAQSPNAPQGAYRCRTCALHAKRTATTDLPPPPYVCPLQLVCGRKDLIERVIKDKLKRHSDGHSDEVVETVTRRAVEYLVTGPGSELLAHLRHLQVELDPIGVGYRPTSGDFFDGVLLQHRLRQAMTLRDCSLFLRIPYVKPSLPIEAKLVDLDFKSFAKFPDWMLKEQSLRHGGWYTDLNAGVDHCLIAEGWRAWVPHYM
ncbi:hypothetical protein K458DRAFT_423895 [Lentithecium fluviatile CBS 122367]|uniref:Inositol-pentakisphosphate 2-kinase n=1 Tax=Lentithecium fluviatile CBS 122367 TaxID=1168545 RepID=A0A6G1IGQ1_9PLEO|nr:hypothetical protein K458DRAFT_423895 [Lentithecium fluviatile CBS 122367]